MPSVTLDTILCTQSTVMFGSSWFEQMYRSAHALKSMMTVCPLQGLFATSRTVTVNSPSAASGTPPRVPTSVMHWGHVALQVGGIAWRRLGAVSMAIHAGSTESNVDRHRI